MASEAQNPNVGQGQEVDQTPDQSLDQTPDQTFDQTPDPTTEQTPDDTSEQTPDPTSEQTPDQTSGQTLGQALETPQDAPQDAPTTDASPATELDSTTDGDAAPPKLSTKEKITSKIHQTGDKIKASVAGVKEKISPSSNN